MPLFGSRKARPVRPTDILERPDYGWVWKPLLGLVVAYLAVTLVLGGWWSLTPDGFDVQRTSAEQRGRLGVEPLEGAERAGDAESADAATAEASKAPAAPLDASPAGRGTVIIATQITLLDTLLDKPGGYLRNDMLPPGLWLDNMPAWELGVLKQARGLAHVLAERGALEDGALREAQKRLDGDSQDWLYPSTEHRLAKARDAYAVVLGELNDQNLTLPDAGEVSALWLSRVGRRLDELTYRLSASVADPEALRELEVDVGQLPGRTPWFRVDDVFFEARGQAWALEHLLAAMVADYGDVVAAADAQALVERLQAELAQAQRRLWSPMVLNGTGFGIFANHSLMMAAYTQRAAQLAEALSDRLAGVSAPAKPEGAPSADEAASQPATQGGAQADAQPAAQSATQAPAVDQMAASDEAVEADVDPVDAISEAVASGDAVADTAAGDMGGESGQGDGVETTANAGSDVGAEDSTEESAEKSGPAEPVASSADGQGANAGEQAADSADAADGEAATEAEAGD